MSGVVARRDPAMKLGVALALSLLLVAIIDPITPLLFLGAAWIAAVALGGVPAATFLRTLAPLVVVALGFVWTNALFAIPAPDDALWRVGPFVASASGLRFGLGIGLRGLAIGAISLAAIRTSDPTRLVVTLIRNARLPYRVGYAMLAAYRFFPLIGDEFNRIRLAQRVRGVRPHSLAGRARAAVDGIVPLFADATRRATRIAIAMDARGFASARERTYWRVTPVTWSDWLFVLGCLVVAAAILGVGALGGWIRLWNGRFSA
ncbi:MAG TPA: energy-coupling factor transporter transmembrane component T [Candidatus Limnocylindria bacterium]